MHEIDLPSWDRRDHFLTYREFDQPHFGMSANVDIGTFYAYTKREAIHFSSALVYVLTRAANAIPSFRLRIRGERVVEHDRVHPSITFLVTEDLFSFCTIEYDDRFPIFTERAQTSFAAAKATPTLADEPGRDDLLFMTAIPWVAFTSFLHPLPTTPADSFPRFAWGKRFESPGGLTMPLGVQAHHALMDGFHAGQYYDRVQSLLSEPERALS